MVRRLVLAIAAAGAVCALVPAANAGECPPGTYKQWTGLYNPRTGERWEACLPDIPPM